MPQQKSAIAKLLNLRFLSQCFLSFACGGLTVAGIGFILMPHFSQATNSSAQASPEPTPAIVAVTALGRLQPHGQVIQLSVPAALRNARVEQLLVNEGDLVKKGQILALLDSYQVYQAAVEAAKSQVEIAKVRLAQVQVGSKLAEREAQKAEIDRLTAEWQNANQELARHQTLYENGAISASLLDSKLLLAKTAQQQIAQAKATLASLTEVRPSDVALATAELSSAQVKLKQAQAELSLAQIYAPKAGQILKIHTKPGEGVGINGILDLGQTQRMDVVAEIHETDIQKIKQGQKAIISSAALAEPVRGTLVEIGRQVDRQQVFDVNPMMDSDRKVVEVKIRVDPADSRRISGLTNLQVEVRIPLSPNFMP